MFSYFHKEKYDRVFSVNYSPITAILPAIIYCKKNKVKLSIWVQDLWPESIIAASNVQSERIQKWVGKLVKFIYLKSDLIFVSNYDFKYSIIEKGIKSLDLKSNPTHKRKFYSKKLSIFKQFLKNEFSLISEGYYTAIGMSLGMSFGVAIGTSFGVTGNSLGLVIGMAIGLAIGRHKDQEAEAQNKVLKNSPLN